MASARWTAADIPDQSGRTAIVTGANSGLGLATARELARAGAAVMARLPQARRRARGAVQAIQRPGTGRRARPSACSTSPI